METAQLVEQNSFETRSSDSREILSAAPVARPHAPDVRQMVARTPLQAGTMEDKDDMDDDTKPLSADELELIKRFKNYTGGYKDTTSGVIYFHSYSQTLFAHETRQKAVQNHREAQTKEVQNTSIQTTASVASQTVRSDLYQSVEKDRIIIVKREYQTADEYHTRRHLAATRIQAFFRAIKAMGVTEVLRDKRNMDEEYKQQLAEARARVLVYLDANHPNSLLSSKQWKSVLNSLSDSLDEYSETIGVRRNEETTLEKALEVVGRPKTWHTSKQENLALDNPEMIRARELSDLSKFLKLPLQTKDRLQILHNVKMTACEFKSKLTDEIVYLVNREVDWLSRGRSAHSCEGIRTRLRHLFLQFMKNPEYNPAAAQAIDQRASEQLHQCAACLNYLPVSDFGSDGFDPRKANISLKCKNDFYIATHRPTDLGLKRLKVVLRIEERLKKEHLKGMFGIELKVPPFNLPQLDIQQLRIVVDQVWNSKSILFEGKRDLGTSPDDLVLTRWNIMRPLDPFNCIQLKVDEAGDHDKYLLRILADSDGSAGQAELEERVEEALSQKYTSSVVSSIRQRHEVAQNYFKEASQ